MRPPPPESLNEFEQYAYRVRKVLPERRIAHRSMPAYMRRDQDLVNAAHDALNFLVHAAKSWREEAEDAITQMEDENFAREVHEPLFGAASSKAE